MFLASYALVHHRLGICSCVQTIRICQSHVIGIVTHVSERTKSLKAATSDHGSLCRDTRSEPLS